MTHDRPHVLVITRIPGDDQYDPEIEYELIHPDECPTETWTDPTRLDGRTFEYTYRTCSTGYEVDNVGLEGLVWNPDLVPGWERPEGGGDDWKGLPEGRYLVAAWGSYDSYFGEWDGGLELIGKEEEVAT